MHNQLSSLVTKLGWKKIISNQPKHTIYLKLEYFFLNYIISISSCFFFIRNFISVFRIQHLDFYKSFFCWKSLINSVNCYGEVQTDNFK